jgi:hypothetical protein
VALTVLQVVNLPIVGTLMEFHSGCKPSDWWYVDLGNISYYKDLFFTIALSAVSLERKWTHPEGRRRKQKVVWTSTLSGDMIQAFNTAPKQFNI